MPHLALSSVSKTVSQFVTENSPVILTTVASLGVLSTAVLAVQATPEAIRRCWPEDGPPEELTKQEVVRRAWRCYIPALSVGMVTIACVVMLNSVHTKRQAALASVYSLTEKAFKEYQEKVIETHGQNKEQKIRDEIQQDRVKANPISNNEVVILANEGVLFYDSISGRYFKSDVQKVRTAVNDLNETLIYEMSASLNEFYHLIGLEGTKMGDQLGWKQGNGQLEVGFSTVMSEDDKPCISLDYKTEPIHNFNKIW